MHLKVHHVVGRNLTQKENLLGNNYLVFHFTYHLYYLSTYLNIDVVLYSIT